MPYVIKDKISFLSEASKILSSTLDYNVTLAIIGKLIVENVADFCLIDVFDGHQMRRLAVNISDPNKFEMVQPFFGYLPDPQNKLAIYDAAKAGTPIVIEKATKKWLKSVSQIPEERKLVEKLELNSFIFVPLKSRGTVIGVITIASIDKNFSYTTEDALFIAELANRAGTAVDNARLYTEAQRALQTRDEFLSIASHELKTPLTSILLNLQLALKRISSMKSKLPEENKIEKMLEISVKQSKRMSSLINDLLNVSLISSGRLKLEKEKVNLNDLIDEVLQRFELQARKSGVRLKFIKDSQSQGYWDRIRIEQAISNIISNAIKYGNKKPVTITSEKSEKYAIVKIEDKGIGMRKSDIKIIFGRFNRGEVKDKFAGLGVGLYICKQIIEAHNGEVEVKSKFKKGSTFIIKLPL